MTQKLKIIRRHDGVEFVHSEGTEILLKKKGFALIEIELDDNGKRVAEVNISSQEFVGNEVALRQQIERKFPHLIQLIDRPDLCNVVLAALAQQGNPPSTPAPAPHIPNTAATPGTPPAATDSKTPPATVEESELKDLPGTKQSAVDTTVAPLLPLTDGDGGAGEPSTIDLAVANYRGELMNLTRDAIVARVAADFPDADPVSGTKGAMSGVACTLLGNKLTAEAAALATPTA
jgi:hypothetical protein